MPSPIYIYVIAYLPNANFPLANIRPATIASAIVVLLTVSRDIVQRVPAEALPPIFPPKVSKAAPAALPLAIERAVFESIGHAAVELVGEGAIVVPVGVASQVGRVMSPGSRTAARGGGGGGG